MMKFTRRTFLKYGAIGSAALFLPRALPTSASPPLRKFLERVPLPAAGLVVATPSGVNTYAFTQRPIERRLHPSLDPTPIWAYDDGSGLAGQAGSFGMVVVAQSSVPVGMTFRNELPETYPAWVPVDTRLTPHGNEVRVLTHLHGGFVAAGSDGNPAVNPNGFGHDETQTVFYPNQLPQMPASLLWFHDHGLGATRLNVFAGLAAAYLVRDQYDTGTEPNPIGLPGGAYEIPLVFQDRQFNADGTFRYPTSTIAGVTWIGEYFGDVMLVNGKVWPYLDVEPRMYRFRLLNGCNARILNLDAGGFGFWQIGAEGGMWDRPVFARSLVLAPAERADVLVDFSPLAGQNLLVRNSPLPAPISSPAPPLVPVMQVRIGTAVTQPGPTTIPASLPGRAANLTDPVTTRYITLNEVGPGTAGWFLNLNGAHFGDASEEPQPHVGDVEDWIYINLTEDTHPMHTHLFTHQVIGRTPFDVAAYQAAYGGPNGVPGGIDPTEFATGPMLPPEPDERGFKDTVKVNPGSFTTIRAKFDLPDRVRAPQEYVHHCHIVEHEDNDMMQSFIVMP